MNVRKTPCEQCPWRRDVEPGQFPADRYEELAETTGSAGEEADLDAPLFGCHKGSPDSPMPCAGWLAAVGYDSLHVRILASRGEIPAEVLRPGDDWPPLFDSFEEMAAYQGGEAGAQSVCLNHRCRDFGRIQTVVPGRRCPSCPDLTKPFPLSRSDR